MEEQQSTPTEPPASGDAPGGDPPGASPDAAGAMTFLFTDIEGSTRLWETYPEAMREARARHEALLRQVIAAHGGSVFNTGGDSLCSAFAGAESALAAALVGQQALLAETWGAMEPLRVRMALHTGAAERHAHDYFGPTLNRITRLLNAGHGGQTLLSGETAARVRAALPERVSLKELGTHRLKDLQQPLAIFQLVHPDLPADFAPLRSLEAFAHNLPRQATRFIGREAQMAEIQELLARSPLLTLTGPGGCGKTRLALQVAAERIEEYPDGVWLVELAALADPGLVIQTAAAALGIREQPGRPLLETILDYLRPRSLLLILDNCEHLLAASASLVGALLRACPRVRVLATSREALAASGEQTYLVPSLSLPPVESAGDSARAGGRLTPDTLSPTPYLLMGFEAVRLFYDRAVLHQAHFALTGENAGAVAEVCRRLDGIPLAIELAAALVNLLTVSEIARGLDDRFRLLHKGSQHALRRQQTLRALIDWSYELLSEAERRLLCRLSVFAGGWTLEAAESICAGGEIDEFEVLELMGRLVEKSLVLAEERKSGAQRYRLLETLRDYGREKLQEMGDGPTVRQRHMDWYLAMAEAAEPALHGTEQPQWLERMAVEHDNLRAALEWCVESGDAETALRLGGALGEFWLIGGHPSEGRVRLEQLLGLADTSERKRLRARALNRVGSLAWQQADYTASQSYQEESLAIYREIGDQPGIAQSLNWLGWAASHRGSYQLARARLEEALAIGRELGDERSTRQSLTFLGSVATWQGDFAAAGRALDQSLAITGGRNEGWDLPASLIFCGILAYQQEEHEKARSVLNEALALAQQGGVPAMSVWSLVNLGHVARMQGDDAAARAYSDEGLAIARQLGMPHAAAYALSNLGLVASAQGDQAAARALHEESLKLLGTAGSSRDIAEALEWLGRALLLSGGHGPLERAARLVGGAEALRDRIGAPVPPCGRADYEDTKAGLRAGLGEDRMGALWSEGRAMTLEQVLEYALRADAGD